MIEYAMKYRLSLPVMFIISFLLFSNSSPFSFSFFLPPAEKLSDMHCSSSTSPCSTFYLQDPQWNIEHPLIFFVAVSFSCSLVPIVSFIAKTISYRILFGIDSPAESRI